MTDTTTPPPQIDTQINEWAMPIWIFSKRVNDLKLTHILGVHLQRDFYSHAF